MSLASAASDGKVEPQAPPIKRYTTWFGKIVDPGTMPGQPPEILYVQVISGHTFYTPLPPPSESGLAASRRIKKYQQLAIQWIYDHSKNKDDKKLLAKKREKMSVPDSMVILSKSPDFDRIAPDAILGTIAKSNPQGMPKKIEYTAYAGSDSVTEHFGKLFPALQALDQKWEIRHFTSSDSRYTGLLLRLADRMMLSERIQMPASEHPDVQVTLHLESGGTRQVSLREFLDWDGKTETAFVAPGVYELDAFNDLRGYYEAVGFVEDSAVPALGNLHHYVISREGLARQWIASRAWNSPKAQLMDTGLEPSYPGNPFPKEMEAHLRALEEQVAARSRAEVAACVGRKARKIGR